MQATFFYQWPQMNMTSISFLYLFLPLSLAFYYIVPHKVRPAALLVISGIYLALAQPWGLPPILASILIDFIIVRFMALYDNNQKYRLKLLRLSISKNLIMILLTCALFETGRTPMFLGITICSISSLDAVISFYRREQQYENNLISFALHCMFFPRLYAGPIQPYHEFSMQLSQIHFSLRNIALGIGQLAQGGLKVALFGHQFIALRQRLLETTALSSSLLSLWGGSLLFAMAMYYTLSGFSDMAQGIGTVYGIFLPQNFYYPYQSRSIADFFERFNMTGTAVLKRNVYWPLKGGKKARVSGKADFIYLILLGMLAGLWFGLRINYLLWGSFLMIFAVLERHVYPRLLRIIPTLFFRIGTFLLVLVSFSLMAAQTPAAGINAMISMLGFTGLPLYDDGTLYLFSTNASILFTGFFFGTNLINIILLWLRKNIPLIADILLGLFNLSFLAVLTSILL